MLVGMGNPLGTRNPHGYGFGQNFIPVMGMSFLTGVFFLRRYGFGQVIPSGSLPIAISTQEQPVQLQPAPARGPLLLVLVLDPRLRASSPSLPGRSRPRPRPAGQGPGPAKGTLLTVSPAAVVHHRTSRRVSRSCRSSAGPCMVGWCTDAAAARARSCQSPRGWEPTVSEPVMVVIYNNVMRYICAVAI
jgi:hypothetical protein